MISQARPASINATLGATMWTRHRRSGSGASTATTPWCGPPSRGFDRRPETLAELARFFQAGDSTLELTQSYASGDLVVLVLIERQHGQVGGLPDQDWSLRVTQVYRRNGAAWELVHRHADPLVRPIGIHRAAALAGDRASD